jgi:hypothetical protein
MCCFQISRPAQPRAALIISSMYIPAEWNSLLTYCGDDRARFRVHCAPSKLNWSHGWPPRIDSSSRLIGRRIAQFTSLRLLQRVVLVHYTLSGQYFRHKANNKSNGLGFQKHQQLAAFVSKIICPNDIIKSLPIFADLTNSNILLYFHHSRIKITDYCSVKYVSTYEFVVLSHSLWELLLRLFY